MHLSMILQDSWFALRELFPTRSVVARDRSRSLQHPHCTETQSVLKYGERHSDLAGLHLEALNKTTVIINFSFVTFREACCYELV
jgi:hypothetical protein